MLFFCPSLSPAQTALEDWQQSSGTQSYFLKSTIKTDANRNIYEAGATISSNGDYDVILTKYNKAGEEIWTRTFDVAGYDDAAVDIYLDGTSNVYIAGTTFNPINSGYQVLVMKYNSSGVFQWSDVNTYTGSLYNVATSITGVSGKIFVGGITYNLTTEADYLAIGYTDYGSLMWDYSWNNADLNDGVTKITCSAGSVSLAGATQEGSDTWKYAIIDLDSSTGLFQSQAISGGSANGIDRITDLTKDESGNIYVTGGIENVGSGYDFHTVKLNAVLDVEWAVTYNSAGSYNDVANALAVDNTGNVYVTGYSESTEDETNYTTIKYSPSGTQIWMESYNGKSGAADTSKAIVLDPSGQPIITGVSINTGNEDFHTIKYDSNGNEIWNMTYNGIANGNDRPFDLAIDSNGDVIVAGQSQVDSIYNYTSVKYIERDIVNPPDEEVIPSSGYFTENNGQLAKTNGLQASEVKYIGGADYPKVYVQDEKLSYVFSKVDSLADDTIHRIDMSFSKTNKDPKIHALNKMDFYQNYYLPTVADGRRERVESFKKLISLDLWDDIDVMFSHNNKGLKYYIICKPGSNTANLAWEYEGATSVSVNGAGELVLTSSIGEVIMPQGEAFEVNSSGTRIDKPWQPTYAVTGSTVSLSLGPYNSSNTLVIEIDKGVAGGGGGGGGNGNMLWNSYYGSTSRSHFNDVDTDKDGNIFVFGESVSGNFPVTSGQVIVEDFSGGRDVIVLRINRDVEPQWLSYFGGSDNSITGTSKEIAESIKIFDFADFDKQIYVCGYTNSGNMTIEDNNGAYEVDAANTCSDGYCQDGFIAQFNEFGMLEWSTYYGNDARERLYGIDVDNLGNIYAVGLHEDDPPLVVKPGADNYTEGEGLILEFAPETRELIWATSWDSDIVTAITIDNDNNIYTTGYTHSDQMPVENTDPNYPITSSLLEPASSFVNKFNTSGELEFSFYLAQGGFGATIAVENNNTLNVGGHSGEVADSRLPLIGGFSESTPDGNFVVKIDVDNAAPQLTHSTFFGGRWNNFEISFPEFSFQSMRLKLDVDYNGNTYIYGCTIDNSPTIQQPISQPANYYVKSNLTDFPNNSTDFNDSYIAAFNSELDLVWSTYHGSNVAEYSGGISSIDGDQRIVVVGTGWSAGVGGIVYDSDSFEATEYDDSFGSTDYYQPAITTDNRLNGYGAIFDVDILNNPVGVQNIHRSNSNVKFWPNPTTNLLNIASNFNIKQIEIYDVSGRLVLNINAKGRNQIVSTEQLENGVYLVKCFSENNVDSFKFIKL